MVDEGEPGVGDEGKHTGKNDPLFVEMMWMGERV